MATLRDLRLKRNLKQEDVASALHITTASLSRLERGLTVPHQSTLAKLAEFYSIPSNEITDYLVPQSKRPALSASRKRKSAQSDSNTDPTDDMSPIERLQIEAYKEGLRSSRHLDQTVRIPVIGYTAAGFGTTVASEWTGEFTTVPRDCLHGSNLSDFFALYVRGSSMEPRISDGDIAVFRRQDDVQSGDLALVVYGDDLDAVGSYGTLKQIRKEDDGALSLIALNPDYETLTLRGDDLASVRIQGRLMQIVRMF